MCTRCLKDERGFCLADPGAYDSACNRCAPLGIDCIDNNNGTRYPIVNLAKVGFGPHLPYIQCSCCVREGRNCDLQRPCDSCVHHGEQCDQWEANTGCFNGRLEPVPGPLYYLALGYGGRSVDDPKDGSSIEHWIGPLTNVYGLPPGTMKYSRWPIVEFVVSLRNSLLPQGRPLPGIKSMYGPPSGITKVLLEVWIRGGWPSALPPACSQYYAGFIHAARGFEQNLVAEVSHQDQLEQAPGSSRPHVRSLTGEEPTRLATAGPSGSRAPAANVLANPVPGPAPILDTTLASDHNLATAFDLESLGWVNWDMDAAFLPDPGAAVVNNSLDADPWNVSFDAESHIDAANTLMSVFYNPHQAPAIWHERDDFAYPEVVRKSIEHDPPQPPTAHADTNIHTVPGNLFPANAHENLYLGPSSLENYSQLNETRPVDDNPRNTGAKSGPKAHNFKCSERRGNRICNNPVPPDFTRQPPDFVVDQPNRGLVGVQGLSEPRSTPQASASKAYGGQDGRAQKEDDVQEIPEAELRREPSEAPSRREGSVEFFMRETSHGRCVRETSLGRFTRASSVPQTGREPSAGPHGN
ncbi:hypothetical protein V8C35DRAFT_290340 [Trichoderma chlorosporum]